MLRLLLSFPLLAALFAAAPLAAADQPYWQCAAFARQFSGIGIHGDAWTWWGQAEGRYARGFRPRVGSVLAFSRSARLRLGHVATVTRILGDRDIRVTHANWSTIDGERGQIEHDVLVRDVSPDNDWSRVRVWFDPLGDLGTTEWGVDGFIYPSPDRSSAPVIVAARASVSPRLAYARLDTLGPPRRMFLSADVVRLALVERRREAEHD